MYGMLKGRKNNLVDFYGCLLLSSFWNTKFTDLLTCVQFFLWYEHEQKEERKNIVIFV